MIVANCYLTQWGAVFDYSRIKICAKEKDILYLMAYTVPVPKEVLLRGLQYKYYIDADFSQYEVFPGQYYPQNRELCFAKEVLNETGTVDLLLRMGTVVHKGDGIYI